VDLPLDVGGVNVSVEVTADRPLNPGTHSPSSTVLTEARLEALPPSGLTSLPDAIVTSAPGMIRGHDDLVHIRGHEVALNPLLDGVAFWENAHAVFSAGTSPEIVETANVMTGGFPAEYGNRFGGVVDIVTKSGLRLDHRGEAAFSAGGEGRRRVAGEVGGVRGALGYYAFGSLFETGRFFSPPHPEAIHDDGEGGHAFLKVDGRLRNGGTLSAVVMADGTNAQIPRTPLDLEMRPLAEPRQRTRQQSAIVSWSRAWSSTIVHASAYARTSSLKLLPAAGPLTAQAQLRRELFTVGAKADVTRLAGRHAIKVGVDAVRLRPEEALGYQYNGYRELTHLLGLPHMHVAGQQINFSGSESGGQVSAFAQDSIQLGKRVTADVGARLDRHALVVTDTHLSPRVNVAVRAGGGAVLHASYNHFFVPPAVEGILSSSAGLTSSISEIGRALAPLEATTEDQFEAGAAVPWRFLQLGVTGYYRASDNPVHTTVWPDSRIYSYASFDRARAYGLEAKAEAPGLSRYGMTGYLNYALGRVYFYNPVTGGFITEAAHLTETNRFLAPMDQTHTLTAGATWRHAATGAWAGTSVEYGSGTPVGHGAAHEHGEGASDHEDPSVEEGAQRVPGHFTGNLSAGIDLIRDSRGRGRLTLRLDVENVADDVYVVAQEGVFSPAQYSIPRIVAVTARIRF
jgi:hypothetical protein